LRYKVVAVKVFLHLCLSVFRLVVRNASFTNPGARLTITAVLAVTVEQYDEGTMNIILKNSSPLAKTWVLAFLSISTALGAANARAESNPNPSPMPPEIPAPRDIAFPGTISLSVDATDTPHGIFRIHETVPVSHGGAMILLYPEWLPGHHAPSGDLDKLAGLVIHAGAAEIPWTRDAVNVYAFHVEPPSGANSLDVDFQFLSPVETKEGRVVMTPNMLNLEWNAVVLYPAGYFARDIIVKPSVTLPAGWQMGVALERASENGATTEFQPAPLNTLVDSPIFAGKYFQRFDLDPGAGAAVYLNVVADQPDELQVKPEQLRAHRDLVQQAYKLFGSHHYDHYDFLLALTDHMGGIGLEHHRSSENATNPKYFKDWAKSPGGRDLLSHEYTHSWNGKFRRPSDLWTPNFNVPMRDSLLWVYEGQTQFWGYVLAVRSGLWSKQEGLDAFANLAATYAKRKGRTWRPLEDTVNDPIIAQRRPIPWRNWQRSEDYYGEGALVWLDADSLIRQKTDGKKSLDDFARAFFGINNGSYVTVTYTFDDVVSALNGVLPYDWAGFLKSRLDTPDAPPLDGLSRGGYKLVYTNTPSDFLKSVERFRKSEQLSYSLGLMVDRKGAVTDVDWDGPAFKAGMTVGSEIVAVNGIAFDPDNLKDAITDAKDQTAPIQLLVKRGDTYTTCSVNYHDGLRYPSLERAAGTPAFLDDLLSPRH
jgi:predicted metalloprotease with PDZ domain